MSRRGQIPDLSAPFADKKYAVGICWSTSRNGYALLVPFAGTRSQKALSPGLWQGTVRNRKVFERKTEGTKEQENLPTLQTMVKQRENRHYHHNSKYKTAFLISHKKSRSSTYMISTITINARPFLSICYYSEPSLIR